MDAGTRKLGDGYIDRQWWYQEITVYLDFIEICMEIVIYKFVVQPEIRLRKIMVKPNIRIRYV